LFSGKDGRNAKKGSKLPKKIKTKSVEDMDRQKLAVQRERDRRVRADTRSGMEKMHVQIDGPVRNPSIGTATKRWESPQRTPFSGGGGWQSNMSGESLFDCGLKKDDLFKARRRETRSQPHGPGRHRQQKNADLRFDTKGTEQHQFSTVLPQQYQGDKRKSHMKETRSSSMKNRNPGTSDIGTNENAVGQDTRRHPRLYSLDDNAIHSDWVRERSSLKASFHTRQTLDRGLQGGEERVLTPRFRLDLDEKGIQAGGVVEVNSSPCGTNYAAAALAETRHMSSSPIDDKIVQMLLNDGVDGSPPPDVEHPRAGECTFNEPILHNPLASNNEWLAGRERQLLGDRLVFQEEVAKSMHTLLALANKSKVGTYFFSLFVFEYVC
jgi:hypothetical protein